jgi:hypothetical protein
MIPCRVKNVAGQQQIYFLDLPGKWKIMEYQDDDQECDKGV